MAELIYPVQLVGLAAHLASCMTTACHTEPRHVLLTRRIPETTELHQYTGSRLEQSINQLINQSIKHAAGDAPVS